MDEVRPGLDQRDVDHYAAQAEAGLWLARGEAPPRWLSWALPAAQRAGTGGDVTERETKKGLA